MPDDFKCDVFPSHNHADQPRVRGLAERLKAAGVRVWGRPKAEVGRMKAKVPIHPSALILHPLPAGRRFIPLLLGDCPLPDALRRYKVVDFREESDAAFAEVPVACRPKMGSCSLQRHELRLRFPR
jgi:hypothetical protein